MYEIYFSLCQHINTKDPRVRQVIWSCHRSDIIGVKILGDSGAGPNLGIQASLRCHLFSCLGRLEHQTTKQRDISGVVWDRCTSLSVNVSKV